MGFARQEYWSALPLPSPTQVQFLGQEDPLEKGLATHSSILALRNPWTEELGGLQSMGSQRVGHTHSDITYKYSYHVYYEPSTVTHTLHLLTHLCYNLEK